MVLNNILAKLLHKLFTPATYTYTFMINESEMLELVRNMTSGSILPVFDVRLILNTGCPDSIIHCQEKWPICNTLVLIYNFCLFE